jgi:hypothetical protein
MKNKTDTKTKNKKQDQNTKNDPKGQNEKICPLIGIYPKKEERLERETNKQHQHNTTNNKQQTISDLLVSSMLSPSHILNCEISANVLQIFLFCFHTQSVCFSFCSCLFVSLSVFWPTLQ